MDLKPLVGRLLERLYGSYGNFSFVPGLDTRLHTNIYNKLSKKLYIAGFFRLHPAARSFQFGILRDRLRNGT